MTLLVALCCVSCDGLASHPGGVRILLVTLCRVSCDGLASYPGGRTDTSSCFMLQNWSEIPAAGAAYGLCATSP